MRRLLFLLPAVPDPPDAGARIRNLGLMRLAAEAWAVDAIAFGQAEEGRRLARLAERAEVAPPPARGTWQRARTLALTRLPDMAERLWSPEMASLVRCWVGSGQYAAVQAEGLEMARYLSLVSAERRIYDAHNAEFLLQRRASQAADSAFARVHSRLQWRRLERFERAVVRNSRLSLAVSEHDANQLRVLAGRARVSVVPNGIDIASYPYRPPPCDVQPNLLFLGKLDYRPNAEALRWFVRQVLPGILEALPTARLFAVGANPPRWLVRAGQHDARIAVTGHVADERPYLARCALLVLPLRITAGSRLKALVALASGLPVVSTALGMEGLDAEADADFVLAESADEWVRAIQRLLSSASLRQTLAEHGRRLVERRYDWAALRPALRAAYDCLSS